MQGQMQAAHLVPAIVSYDPHDRLAGLRLILPALPDAPRPLLRAAGQRLATPLC